MNFSFEKKFNDLNEFVEYWSSFYNYNLEKFYLEKISDPYNKDAIELLFKWKNGGNLSKKKKGSVQKHYIEKLSIFSQSRSDKQTELVEEFLKDSEGGKIWNIFFAHCLCPNIYPIFDQHTYRAMKYLKDSNSYDQGFIDLYNLNKNTCIIEIYKNEYIPFYKDLSDQMGYSLHTCIDEKRKLDRALFKYGQFLKNYGSNKPLTS